MLEYIASCEMKSKSIQSPSDYIQYQREYVLDLLKTTNYPSTITNTMAKEHHTSWLKEFDDRLENFIQIEQ